MDWLALSIALFLTFRSVQREAIRTRDESRLSFSLNWAQLGVFVSFCCFLDFLADCGRFVNWQSFQYAAAALSLINMLVLLPIWLLWLAVQLPSATEKMHSLAASDDFGTGTRGGGVGGGGGGGGGGGRSAQDDVEWLGDRPAAGFDGDQHGIELPGHDAPVETGV